MFKKNQSNWKFSINTAMYSCVAIRAGIDETPRMERFAKLVNGLSRGLFSLRALTWIGCLISSSCGTPSKMERFAKMVYDFWPLAT